jgi:type I restriction enzyme S subunit
VDISSVDNHGKVITEARQLPGKEAPSRARQVIRTNDVLVATTRPNLNAVALVPPELDAEICSTGFCVLRCNDQLDPEYLFMFVQSVEFIRGLSDLVKGALYPAVTDGQVRSQRLPLPPLSEQRRIAASLREQFAALAEARAAVQYQFDAARALPVAHLRFIFENPTARNWPKKPLADLLTQRLRTGLSKSNHAPPTSRCLTLSSVRNGFLDVSAAKPVSLTEKEETANALRPGNFYVVRGNGNKSLVARGALPPGTIPPNLIFPDLLIEVAPNPNLLLPSFLRWVWDSPAVRADLEARSVTSAGIYKINLGNLSTVPIPTPPIDQQRRTAEACHEASSAIRALSAEIAARFAALDHLPTAFLREAFAGRI